MSRTTSPSGSSWNVTTASGRYGYSSSHSARHVTESRRGQAALEKHLALHVERAVRLPVVDHRTYFPVRLDPAIEEILFGEPTVGERGPHFFRRGNDVGDVNSVSVRMGSLLPGKFQ